MKRLLTALALLPLAAMADTIRILPIGDSITEGIGWEAGGGYRAVLREKLLAAGYDVQFVGNNTTFDGGVAAQIGTDFLHEGHGGWYLYTIHESLAGWMSTMEDPHVILVLLGTNDFGGHFDYKNILYRMGGFLDDLSAKQPSAQIIISTLLPRTADWDENYLKPYFNDGLPALVAAHQAKGQKVTMVDLYSKLTRGTPEAGGDFPDELHPNEGGFRKMAQAWSEKIQEVLPVSATQSMTPNTLAVVNSTLDEDRRGLTIYFNRRVNDAAADLANYTFSGSFQPYVARVSEDRRSVHLKGQLLARNEFTRVRIRNVAAEADGAPIADRQVEVSRPYGAEHYVPEAAQYKQVYALDIPQQASFKDSAVPYLVDKSASVGAYSRVAYYLELEKADGRLNYVWVSMDKFTDDPSKLGVPTRASGAVFQQYVTNIKVWSNQETVKPGEKARGNIEFWPYNYVNTPSLGVGVAKQDCFDVDDTIDVNGDYASMQIHDSEALTPILCYNNWGNGGEDSCLGIGAGPVYDWSSRDWTFAKNTGDYVRRRLEVYVLEDGSEPVAPELTSSVLTPVAGGARLELVFDQAIVPSDCTPERFALSDGTRVASVSRSEDGKTLVLTLAQRPAEGANLSVNGLHAGTATYTGSVAVPALTTMPADVRALVGDKANGYELVYAVDIPELQDWSFNKKVNYRVDNRITRPFDRVAYFMELGNGSDRQWIWVSCDKYTDGVTGRELSIPVGGEGAPGRYRLSNLDVASNVPGVTTGSHATGVAELWTSVYYNAKMDEAFGGSSDVCDWNDWWSTGDRNRSDGYGCFQFFATSDDLTTGETLFAFNGWGKSTSGTGVMDVGIGTAPTAAYMDWTWAANATQYATRRVYAFVRPTSSEQLGEIPTAVTEKVGDSADGFKLLYRIDLEDSITLNNGNYGNMSVNTEVYDRIHGVDNKNLLAGSAYTRVAYCLELVKKNSHETSWIWTAFDWQGDSFAAIDLPTAEGGAIAMKVENLEVKSNVGGIVTGEKIATGNIEFTPYNYWTPNNNFSNTYIVPSASQETCDFGDHLYGIDNDGVGHYGCMQVHNYGSYQTLWAVNHFNGGPDNGNQIAVGIGNNGGYHPDWTNEQNADQYEKKTLYVMIQTCPRVTAQTAMMSTSRRRVSVTCADEVASVLPAWFAVNGVAPDAVHVSESNPREVMLDFTTALSEADAYTVAVAVPGAVRREIACATSRALPACLETVEEAKDYVLVNDLAVRTTAPNYATRGVDYTTDETRFGSMAYDRVGYLFELKSKDQDDYRWVWVSMDKFTDNIAQLGIPTVENDGLLQRLVSNLHVEAGSTTGEVAVRTGDWADGNIEFTPFNYDSGRTFKFEGAPSGVYDYDDTLPRHSAAGYGCMQVHNYREKETVFAINNFNSDSSPGVTIGNASGTDPDGTWLNNGANFEIIDLRIFVRPLAVTQGQGVGPEFYLQPQSVKYEANRRETVTLSALAPAANYYQWYKDGKPLVGEQGLELTVPATRDSAGRYQVIAYFDEENYTVSEVAILTPRSGFKVVIR